ncbi:MAG: 2-oxoglutarate synthase, partial [Desulfobacterales bacterium]
KKNRLTPKLIEAILSGLPQFEGSVPENRRREYGQYYRELAITRKPPLGPTPIAARYDSLPLGRQEVVLLGSAGQRIITAGELLCLAGLFAGLQTTQKNEYNITVLRGLSISELILSPEEIDYTGIERPSVIVALAQEGVDGRRSMFAQLDRDALILQVQGVEIPACGARLHRLDFKSQGIKKPDWALASLAVLAGLGQVIRPEMLEAALKIRFKGQTLEAALALVELAQGGI